MPGRDTLSLIAVLRGNSDSVDISQQSVEGVFSFNDKLGGFQQMLPLPTVM